MYKETKNNIINGYNRPGETPLQTTHRLRETLSIDKDIPITYAGRLDPMAEGVLVLLVGEAVHQKEEYLAKEKEYSFSILFGFETDSYDTLGLITKVSEDSVSREDVQNVLSGFVGKQEQKYPPFSSKPVQGKPLFEWAREGNLDQIEIPTHTVDISDLWLKDFKQIQGSTIKERINRVISLVTGDFRQTETLALWEESLEDKKEYYIAEVNMICSSGTYVRALVHDLGKKLGVSATTYTIVRSRVGDFNLEDSLR